MSTNSAVVQRMLKVLKRLFPSPVHVAFVLTAGALLGIGFLLEQQLHGYIQREQLQLMLIAWDSVAWFVWLMAAPLVLGLVRRFPLVRGSVARNLPRLVLGSVVIYAIVINLRFVLRVAPNLWSVDGHRIPVSLDAFGATTLVSLPMDFMTFGGFVAAAIAIDYYFKHRHRVEETLHLRLRTAQLESELAQAELSALRGQLHPHFLFNSFNAVSTLVRQQRNAAAVEVITQLCEVLRLAIDRTGMHDLSLEDELDFIRQYLEIERIRFGEKLRLEFDVEPRTLAATVPNLVLQPLVENAIKHGISRRTAPGRLLIGAHVLGNQLELVIENDGADPDSTPPLDGRRGGIGLSNTRRRLERVYGSKYRLDLIRRPDGGMRAELKMPFAPAEP